MEIDDEQQMSTDFDWFGVDEEGLIGHFTSAGFKRIPRSSAQSQEDLKFVTDYFLHADLKGGHRLNQSLGALVADWKGEGNEARYLSSFVAMADKGLFSYDIDSYVSPGVSYFCVAYPEMPLRVDLLPDKVRRIVSRTVLKGVRLREKPRVPYEDTLDM